MKSLINYLAVNGMFDKLPDKEYLKLRYFGTFHRVLNLSNPSTFNEKLNWMKLYDRNPQYPILVDKARVKDYVRSIIGDKYIIPTYGVWDSFDDIDFSTLPEQFILKTTHDSGGVVVMKDKSTESIAKAKAKLTKSLNNDFYKWSREWPYSQVKPQIIAEEFLTNKDGSAINDVKLQCFNGKVDNIFLCVDRFSQTGVKYHYFDTLWNYLPYCPYPGINASNINIPKPENLDDLIGIAEKLSVGFPEMRVDLYNIDNAIYFGELTIFSMSGFDTTITHEADRIMGAKLDLSHIKRI